MSLIVFEGHSLPELYPHLLRDVMERGALVNPRGKPNRELRPVVLRTDRWECLAGAGVSYRFALAEAMAVVCAWNDTAWLKRYNARIASFSDDGITFHGSYGVRMDNQLKHVIERLKADPDSRQAVVNIWMGADAWTVSKDLPCNTQVYLKIRNNKLDLTVFRRSADLIWGVPYDHHVFHALLRAVSGELQVDPGTLTEYIDSLHVYEEAAEFYDAGRVRKALTATPTPVPHPWPSNLPLVKLRRILTQVRNTVEDNRDVDLLPIEEQLLAYLEGK